MPLYLPLATFVTGLLAVGWVAFGFLGTHPLALAMTLLIAAVYAVGALELKRYATATASLHRALVQPAAHPDALPAWLSSLHPSLQSPVRLRMEGERAALPGPALAPYLAALLVMLGMLGTFLGMIVTFQGAIHALSGSADLAAMRTALAAPIQGLGLSFGTSVAGVAASAALGLLSALARRDRLQASRALDAAIAGAMRPCSRAHRQEATFQALQQQAEAMPRIADQLQALAEGLGRHSSELHAQLASQQQHSLAEAAQASQALSQGLLVSLQTQLTRNAEDTAEALQTLARHTLDHVRAQAEHTQQHLLQATRSQVDDLTQRWDTHARHAASQWQQAFEAQAQALRAHDTERLTQWHTALHDSHATLQQQLNGQWQAISTAFEHSAQALASQWGQAVSEASAASLRLLADTEALVQARVHTEATGAEAQAAHLAQLQALWQAEAAAQRQAEQRHSQAAIERLQALEATVAQHLASLGQALEAPLNRLLHSASEVPQAAAGVITQLRQDMALLGERDNAALAERTALIGQLHGLLSGLQATADQQRQALAQLAEQTTLALTQAAERFEARLDATSAQHAQTQQHAATRVAASAVELASLGEAFTQGVAGFQHSSEQLLAGLQRIEGALAQAMQRGDEQLAWCAAQAREVIDLSITAQQGILDDLRRLQPAGGAA